MVLIDAKMGNFVSSLRWNAFRTFFSHSRVRSLFVSTRKLSSSAPKKGVPLLEPFEEPQAKHIVILGGAYAGLSTLLNLQKILSEEPHVPGPYSPPAVSALPRTSPKITLLDERDGIYHTIGTPLVHTSPDIARNTQRMWKRYEEIPYLRDVRVVQGRVQSVDPVRKQLVYAPSNWSDGEKGKTMAYDYLVCATGLKRAWPVQPRATTKADFIRDTKELVEELIEAKESVVVVGGG
jgi:NADH dehydrogenase FAD-containing subunit